MSSETSGAAPSSAPLGPSPIETNLGCADSCVVPGHATVPSPPPPLIETNPGCVDSCANPGHATPPSPCVVAAGVGAESGTECRDDPGRAPLGLSPIETNLGCADSFGVIVHATSPSPPPLETKPACADSCVSPGHAILSSPPPLETKPACADSCVSPGHATLPSPPAPLETKPACADSCVRPGDATAPSPAPLRETTPRCADFRVSPGDATTPSLPPFIETSTGCAASCRIPSRAPGLARCKPVFPLSVVVGVAVPAAVCRRGLYPRSSGGGRFLSGVNIPTSATLLAEEAARKLGDFSAGSKAPIRLCANKWFTPRLFIPGLFTPRLFTPELFTPELFTPRLITPGLLSPELFTPELFTPGLFAARLLTAAILSPELCTPGLLTSVLFTPGLFTNGLFSNGLFNLKLFNLLFTPGLFTASSEDPARFLALLTIRKASDPLSDRTPRRRLGGVIAAATCGRCSGAGRRAVIALNSSRWARDSMVCRVPIEPAQQHCRAPPWRTTARGRLSGSGASVGWSPVRWVVARCGDRLSRSGATVELSVLTLACRTGGDGWGG